MAQPLFPDSSEASDAADRAGADDAARGGRQGAAAAAADPDAPPGFDAVRTGWNGIGLALYALEPGGDVTLEVHSEGEVYSFRAPTAADAFALAFPPAPPVDVFG